jgi:hypothetical protein
LDRKPRSTPSKEKEKEKEKRSGRKKQRSLWGHTSEEEEAEQEEGEQEEEEMEEEDYSSEGSDDFKKTTSRDARKRKGARGGEGVSRSERDTNAAQVSHTLTYADVCWRMLAYAGVC